MTPSTPAPTAVPILGVTSAAPVELMVGGEKCGDGVGTSRCFPVYSKPKASPYHPNLDLSN